MAVSRFQNGLQKVQSETAFRSPSDLLNPGRGSAGSFAGDEIPVQIPNSFCWSFLDKDVLMSLHFHLLSSVFGRAGSSCHCVVDPTEYYFWLILSIFSISVLMFCRQLDFSKSVFFERTNNPDKSTKHLNRSDLSLPVWFLKTKHLTWMLLQRFPIGFIAESLKVSRVHFSQLF